MIRIKEFVSTLPPNKLEAFDNFQCDLILNWKEMDEMIRYIRRMKQVPLAVVQKMPYATKLRLACYIYYDEIFKIELDI